MGKVPEILFSRSEKCDRVGAMRFERLGYVLKDLVGCTKEFYHGRHGESMQGFNQEVRTYFIL